MILNIICIIVLIFVSFKFTIKDFISLSPFALATIFYVIPLWSKGKNLRNVVSLKLFLIAFSWAGVTVLFPLIHEEITFSSNVWITFFQRFLFIVAVTIPFDIRDLNFDLPEIRTLPQIIGINNSKYVGTIALFLFFALEFFKVPKNESAILIISVVSFVSLLFLILSGKNRNRFYCSFWVESLPILWLLLLLI
jgi:hypothetical protein